MITAIVLAPLLRIAFCTTGEAGRFATHFLPFCRMDGLVLGMLIAWALESPGWISILRQKSGWIVGVTIVAFLSLALLTMARGARKSRAGNVGLYRHLDGLRGVPAAP